MNQTEIFAYKPETFKSNLLVAGGVLVHDNRFLLLQRHPEKSYGLKWNLPAGKVEKSEPPHLAAQREIQEETGINIHLDELKPLHIFFLKRGPMRIEFHLFETTFKEKPSIDLKMDENINALWLSHEEALELPLIGGGAEIINFYFRKP